MSNMEKFINDKIIHSKGLNEINTDNISDGYHTFGELYNHRAVLFNVILKVFKERAWKALKHEDGTMYYGMFIVGIETPQGQYTYHYNSEHWDMFDVKIIETAPKYDGHKPEDIVRLYSLFENE